MREMRILHLIFCILLLAISACADNPDEAIVSGNTMGTTYAIKVPGVTSAELSPLKLAAEAVLADINAAMSTYQPDSAISRFNNSEKTTWFEVPVSFVVVADAALQVARQTEGAFDPTVGPIVQRWGFGASEEQPIPPPAAELEQLRAMTGYRHLQTRLSPPAVRKSIPGLQLDFSAIAKGYAVDRLAQLVSDQGFEDYLVEIGGELRVSGNNQQGEHWRVGVEYPDADGTSVKSALLLNGAGVASSGDYRNFRQADGARYSHIIDPRTAAPVTHNLAAVTVVANNAMYADAWATALMVLGAEQGQQVASARSLAALLVQRQNDEFSVLRSELFSQLRTASE